MEAAKKIILKAKKGCPACKGSGVIYDSVPMPFGSGNCQMPSDCECAYEDVDEAIMRLIEEGKLDAKVVPAGGDNE